MSKKKELGFILITASSVIGLIYYLNKNKKSLLSNGTTYSGGKSVSMGIRG